MFLPVLTPCLIARGEQWLIDILTDGIDKEKKRPGENLASTRQQMEWYQVNHSVHLVQTALYITIHNLRVALRSPQTYPGVKCGNLSYGKYGGHSASEHILYSLYNRLPGGIGTEISTLTAFT